MVLEKTINKINNLVDWFSKRRYPWFSKRRYGFDVKIEGFMASRKLEPIRHKNHDFFACNIFDTLPFFKDDMASMEHPIFSLSTRPDRRKLKYEHNGKHITVTPSGIGLATIHDKDILLYCISHLRAAVAEGKEPNQTIQFTAYDYLVSTNRKINGAYYKRFKDGLVRLMGTVISTDIKTGGKEITKMFSLIDSAGVVKEDKTGRVIAVEIKLSDWAYNSVLSNELLTINSDYFRIRQPTERRIYEIARKHCGDQKEFKISIDKLHKKLGTTTPLKKFKFSFKSILESNHIPDYSISMTENMVTFVNRNFEKKQQNSSQSIIPPLPTSAYEKAKQAAPRLDVYAAESDWREWSHDKEKPRNTVGAFIGFCKRKAKELGLS